MDKEVNVNVLYGDPLGIGDITEQISIKVSETYDEFVFTTISNWWLHEFKQSISKQDLIDALTKRQPMKPRYSEEWHCYCGRCNKRLSLKHKPQYCMRCGQKVKL